jgi:hypothetical protein
VKRTSASHLRPGGAALAPKDGKRVLLQVYDEKRRRTLEMRLVKVP